MDATQSLLTNPLGWTPADEDLQTTSELSTSFYDNSSNITVNLTTPRPSGVGEDGSLGTMKVTIAAIGGITSFITVIGNLLILYAFCVDRRLRTYTNYYIVSLSVADLFIGSFSMPIYTMYWVLGYWPVSGALCDIYVYIGIVLLHISQLGILVISIDRYQAICHPLKHLQQRTLRHAMFMISISYIIPLLLWLPYTILWPYIVGARRIKPGLCYPQYIVDSLPFTMFSQVCMYWIPVTITSVLNWRIYLIIRRKKKAKRPVVMEELSGGTSTKVTTREQMTNIGGDESSQKPDRVGLSNSGFVDGENLDTKTDRSIARLQRRSSAPKSKAKAKKDSHRATLTLTLIFIVLLVTSTPRAVVIIIQSLCPSCLPTLLYQTAIYMVSLTSTLNPFCYAVANPLYLAAFTKLVCRARRRKAGSDGRSSIAVTK